jgi:hypothetical protein
LNGWNFDEVARVTPPGKKGEPGDGYNDLVKNRNRIKGRQDLKLTEDFENIKNYHP